MPPVEALLPFIFASLIVAFVPGPSMLYAAAQTVALGRKAGWWSALGFHAAGLVHIAAAALGVSALINSQPALFSLMQYLGGGYLAWMGVSYLRNSSVDPIHIDVVRKGSVRKALLDSVLVEILNPKSYVFFFLFLPQFAEPSAQIPLWMQIGILGLAVNLLFTTTDLILVETSHLLVQKFSSESNIAKYLRIFGGGILILLGVNLVAY